MKMNKITFLIGLTVCSLPLKAETLNVTGTVHEILPIKGSTTVFLNSNDISKMCKHKYSVVHPDENNLLGKIKSYGNNPLVLSYEIENVDRTGEFPLMRCRITNVGGHGL